jgi:uncharacterized protein YciI
MLSSGPTPDEERLVDAHFDYLKELLSRGRLILAGRTLTTDASTFGIVVFRAPSAEDARAILENDPAVQGGVFTTQLFPYRVALMEGQTAE